jgi:hypothetical protein
MKKFIFFTGLFLYTVGLFAQNDTTVNKDAPEIVFELTTYDFGTIAYGSNGTCEYTFKNTGKDPLIINDVQKSCGCTGVDWTKEPIQKGHKGVIKATYNTKIVGSFQKNITVHSNAKTPTIVLTFKGVVEKAPAENAPAEQTK